MPNAITADDSAQARIERRSPDLPRSRPAALADPRADRSDSRRGGARRGPSPSKTSRATTTAATDATTLALDEAPAARRADPVRRPRRPVRTTRGRRPLVAGHPPPTRRTRSQDPLSPRAGPGRARTAWRSHHARPRDSLRQTEQVQAQLAAVGIEPWPLDGVQALACLGSAPPRRRAAARPGRARRGDRTGGDHGRGGRLTAPSYSRCHLLGPERAESTRADPRWLRHSDGTLEEILHLGTPPIHTTLWWLMHLLSAPLPITVAVHIRVGSRAQSTRSPTTALEAAGAATTDDAAERSSIGSDEHEALAEAELLDAELGARSARPSTRSPSPSRSATPRQARRRSTSWSKRRRGNSRPTPALGSCAAAGAAYRD